MTLEELEAARDPAMGYLAGQGGYFQRDGGPRIELPAAPQPAPQPAPAAMPTMAQFDAGPATPTYADLYKSNPAMGYSRLRELKVPEGWRLEQVPLRPGSDDWKRFQDQRKYEFEVWKANRAASGSDLGERRLAEAQRAAQAREAAAATRQAGIDEKEARKVADAEKADRLRLEGSLEQSNLAVSAARKALSDVGLLTSGLIGGMTKWIPGSPALDLDQALEPVRAITSFEQLNRMKEASRTGGALGQIAVRELDLLGASVASLNTSQGPDQLKANLRRVIQHFKSWQEKVQKAWEVEGPPSGEPRGVPGVREKATTGTYDADKERRYQEWKARQQR